MEADMVEKQQIRIGIGIMILKEGKVLLGKRKGSHGEGEYSFPGGHLEYMESFEECVLREIKEECGIEIQNLRFQFLANMQEYAPKHYCHIGMIADWKSGEPQVLEPEKCERWEWYSLKNLPSPIFLSCQWGIDSHREGFIFKDST
jgi:8-oxo-dGTP diphosphatase